MTSGPSVPEWTGNVSSVAAPSMVNVAVFPVICLILLAADGRRGEA